MNKSISIRLLQSQLSISRENAAWNSDTLLPPNPPFYPINHTSIQKATGWFEFKIDSIRL